MSDNNEQGDIEYMNRGHRNTRLKSLILVQNTLSTYGNGTVIVQILENMKRLAVMLLLSANMVRRILLITCRTFILLELFDLPTNDHYLRFRLMTFLPDTPSNLRFFENLVGRQRPRQFARELLKRHQESVVIVERKAHN